MLTALFQNSSNLIDIGFTVLTTVICIKFLTQQTFDSGKTIGYWRKELKGVEQTIRNLISEAMTVNNNLDKTLVKRKSDLEKLLHNLEKIENKLDQVEEFPNDSWRRKEEDLRLENIEQVNQTSPNSLAEDARDSISLSTKDSFSGSAKSKRTIFTKTAKSLCEQIEIKKPENIKQTSQTPRNTTVIDPVTLKVAKRMLAQGKEIHVVAKKLELSVSQIRVIDRLLREQGMESEAGPNFKRLEAIPATKIVRNMDERIGENSQGSLIQADSLNLAFELAENNIVDTVK